jgi:hypothetical protein
MKTWFEDAWWSWGNCIHFRLDYNDRIDYCAFWEELNMGYYQMQDEYIMSQPGFDPYNLSGRDPYYSYVMSKKWFEKLWGKGVKPETMYVSQEAYDTLVEKINNPDPEQIESLKKLMNRKSPWEVEE